MQNSPKELNIPWAYDQLVAFGVLMHASYYISRYRHYSGDGSSKGALNSEKSTRYQN